MDKWQVFFESKGDYVISICFDDYTDTISIEELYQQFKKRLIAEMLDDQQEDV